MFIEAYDIIFEVKFIHLFFVCRVSSQAIRETFLRIFKAPWEISFKLPNGVQQYIKHYSQVLRFCEMMLF